MPRFLSQLFRRNRQAEPSPRDLVLAQRERLLGCALQILQDAQVAQDVVLRGLSQALQSPLLVPLSGVPAPMVVPAGPEALGRWLDRLIVNLSLSRLRQASPLRPGARGADGAEPAEPRPLLDLLRRGPIPTSPPPLRPRRPTPVPAALPERATPSGGLPVQLRGDVVPEGARPTPALLSAPILQDDSTTTQRTPPAEAASRQKPAEIQQLERLALALRTLSPDVRITVTLVLMQGRSLAEAAELLGCSEESCRYWLQHGRKLLRRMLQRDLLEVEPEPPSASAESPTGVLYDVRRGKKATARA